jgi:hypothetical protein
LRQAIIAVVVGTFMISATLPVQAQSAALATRTSDANGVRIVIKPKSVAGAAWEFEVTMDTHTKPLSDDLTKTTVLLDDRQQRYTPTAWQGDPPGGHHRKGVLRFPAPAGETKSFSIQMDDVGSAGKRVLQWNTK